MYAHCGATLSAASSRHGERVVPIFIDRDAPVIKDFDEAPRQVRKSQPNVRYLLRFYRLALFGQNANPSLTMSNSPDRRVANGRRLGRAFRETQHWQTVLAIVGSRKNSTQPTDSRIRYSRPFVLATPPRPSFDLLPTPIEGWAERRQAHGCIGTRRACT